MKQRTSKIEKLYNDIKREVLDITIDDLIISKTFKHVEYSPCYQRHYIWTNKKAINLIETVLINGVIPPIIAMQTNDG